MKIFKTTLSAIATLLILPATNISAAQSNALLTNEREMLPIQPRQQLQSTPISRPVQEQKAANPVHSLPTQSQVQPPRTLHLSREPVVFSQWLGGNKQSLISTGISLESRSYTLTVDGRALQKGVTLMTDADGALVMLSKTAASSANKTSTLSLQDFEIGSSVGQMKASDQAMSLGAEVEQLKQVQPQLFGRSMAFKLAPQLGNGPLIMRAKSAAASDRFVIHVYDKNSKHALQAQYKNADVAQGGAFLFNSSVTGLNLKQAQAEWIYADGTRLNAKLNQTGKQFQVSVPAKAHAPGELVTLKMKTRTVIAGKELWRDIDLPINPHVKTAQLAATPSLKRIGHRYWISVPVNAKSESRFEVRALIGDGNNNRLYYSANYFSPGSATLSFELDASQVALAEQGKLVLRELQLLDQGQLAVLSNQQLNMPLTIRSPIMPRSNLEIQQH